MSFELAVPPPAMVERGSYQIGCRFWKITANDRLVAPYRSGQVWSPGINRGRCGEGPAFQGDCREWCYCGLYAIHYEPGLTRSGYFNLETGSYEGTVIGGIAYWNGAHPAPTPGDAIRAEYAALGCLITSPRTSTQERDRIASIARHYRVEVVDHTELELAVKHYVARSRAQWFRREAPLEIGDWTQGPLWGERKSPKQWRRSKRPSAPNIPVDASTSTGIYCRYG